MRKRSWKGHFVTRSHLILKGKIILFSSDICSGPLLERENVKLYFWYGLKVYKRVTLVKTAWRDSHLLYHRFCKYFLDLTNTVHIADTGNLTQTNHPKRDDNSFLQSMNRNQRKLKFCVIQSMLLLLL